MTSKFLDFCEEIFLAILLITGQLVAVKAQSVQVENRLKQGDINGVIRKNRNTSI